MYVFFDLITLMVLVIAAIATPVFFAGGLYQLYRKLTGQMKEDDNKGPWWFGMFIFSAMSAGIAYLMSFQFRVLF